MSGRTARAARIEHPERRKPLTRSQQSLRTWGIAGLVIALIIGIGYAIYATGLLASTSLGSAAGKNPNMAMDMGTPKSADHGSSQYPYAIGDPAVGAVAPTFNLKSTLGGTFDLSSYAGNQQVLLYFQEGLTCQPCWDQIVAIQKDTPAFHALGIDTIVSITNDPYDQLKQKANDEGLTIPVLADENGAVSNLYTALRYGMMMGMNPGHTFILVGTDGRIRWRADYGGPPKYTMYLPPAALLNDLKQGLGASS
jgi:peroxiredoxin